MDLYYPRRRRKVKQKGVPSIIQENLVRDFLKGMKIKKKSCMSTNCTCNSFDSGLELLPKYEVLKKFGKLQKDKDKLV